MKNPKVLWFVIPLLLTAVVLFPSVHNGWLNWDDGAYVLNNPLVKDFSFSGIKKLFTTQQVVGCYHPITLLSLSIDYAIGQRDPFFYHFSNLVIHLLNTCLVFALIFKLKPNYIVAFVTTILFGIHPMHLESIAWISERKDLLYTFFLLLSCLLFLEGQKKDSLKIWGLCFVSFLLSLLSKPSAVVIPVLFVSLSYLQKHPLNKKYWLRLTPFFLLSLLFGIINIKAQQAGNAVHNVQEYSYFQTFFIACYNFVIYIIKALIPFKLSAFHPFPFDHISSGLPWYIYASSIPVIALIIWGILNRNKYREVIFGFLFFSISIALMLQFLPFGRAISGERYTYVAYIGLFFLLGLSLDLLITRKGSLPAHLIFGIAVTIYSGITFLRIDVWENGETLWADVIEKYPNDHFAYCNLGDYYFHQGINDEALTAFNKALNLKPESKDALMNRARLYERLQKNDEAFQDYNQLLRLNPQEKKALLNRGVLYFRAFHDPVSAIRDLEKAIEIDPHYEIAYLNLGNMQSQSGLISPAISTYSTGLEHHPNSERLYRYRAISHYQNQDTIKAHQDLSRSLELNPQYGEAYFLRSKVNYDQGKFEEAWQDVQLAKKWEYSLPKGYFEALEKMGK